MIKNNKKYEFDIIKKNNERQDIKPSCQIIIYLPHKPSNAFLNNDNLFIKIDLTKQKNYYLLTLEIIYYILANEKIDNEFDDIISEYNKLIRINKNQERISKIITKKN